MSHGRNIRGLHKKSKLAACAKCKALKYYQLVRVAAAVDVMERAQRMVEICQKPITEGGFVVPVDASGGDVVLSLGGPVDVAPREGGKGVSITIPVLPDLKKHFESSLEKVLQDIVENARSAK